MNNHTQKNQNEIMFGVKIPAYLSKKIKIEAANRDIRIKDFVVSVFKEYFLKFKDSNNDQ